MLHRSSGGCVAEHSHRGCVGGRQTCKAPSAARPFSRSTLHCLQQCIRRPQANSHASQRSTDPRHRNRPACLSKCHNIGATAGCRPAPSLLRGVSQRPTPEDSNTVFHVHTTDISCQAGRPAEGAGLSITSDAEVARSLNGSEQPPEAGIIPEATRNAALCSPSRVTVSEQVATSTSDLGFEPRVLYQPAERSQIRESWTSLMRWSKALARHSQGENGASVLTRTSKVVVFGGGSFGTAVGAALARQKCDLAVTMLLRDPYVCRDINESHCNPRYLQGFTLPHNMTATTSMAEAISGAEYAVHAVPVQHSRAFLHSIRDILPPHVPIISVSKGLEVGSGEMMSEVIPGALGRKQPAVFLSGPSFAREVMELRPTGVVAACKDKKLAREVQQLLASSYMRVNTTTDVVGVEICGALKNVLAIAAGIVEGMDLGHNAMAALISQGCAEIRWLAEKMGAKATTIAGLSGLGDIMLTCYGDLSRNRSVGIRLGRGEHLRDILASSSQVAEGVATAGAVVGLARKYRVSLPVLTAAAQVLDGNISPKKAVYEIMNLPQIEER